MIICMRYSRITIDRSKRFYWKHISKHCNIYTNVIRGLPWYKIDLITQKLISSRYTYPPNVCVLQFSDGKREYHKYKIKCVKNKINSWLCVEFLTGNTEQTHTKPHMNKIFKEFDKHNSTRQHKLLKWWKQNCE